MTFFCEMVKVVIAPTVSPDNVIDVGYVTEHWEN